MFRKIWLLLTALLASAPARADTAVVASWYGHREEGRLTASGCAFHADGLTAASRTLPLGTLLRVRRGDRSVLVLVNDRGPYVHGRHLDLSRRAADWLGMREQGVAVVEIEAIGMQPTRCLNRHHRRRT